MSRRAVRVECWTPERARVIARNLRNGRIIGDAPGSTTAGGSVDNFNEVVPFTVGGWCVSRYISGSSITYSSVATFSESSVRVPIGITKAEIEVYLAANMHPYTGGVPISGTVIRGGVGNPTSWDQYSIRQFDFNNVLKNEYFLNYNPIAQGSNPVIKSTFVIPVVAGDVLRFFLDTKDNLTTSATENNSRLGIIFNPHPLQPGRWEAGVVTTLRFS